MFLTEGEGEEREEMERGRSLESKFWSLESSHSAKRVSIRSSSSSTSASDFSVTAGAAVEDDDDCSAIVALSFFLSRWETKQRPPRVEERRHWKLVFSFFRCFYSFTSGKLYWRTLIFALIFSRLFGTVFFGLIPLIIGYNFCYHIVQLCEKIQKNTKM